MSCYFMRNVQCDGDFVGIYSISGIYAIALHDKRQPPSHYYAQNFTPYNSTIFSNEKHMMFVRRLTIANTKTQNKNASSINSIFNINYTLWAMLWYQENSFLFFVCYSLFVLYFVLYVYSPLSSFFVFIFYWSQFREKKNVYFGRTRRCMIFPMCLGLHYICTLFYNIFSTYNFNKT